MVDKDSVNKLWGLYLDKEINHGENRLYLAIEEAVTDFLRSIVYPENFLEQYENIDNRYVLTMYAKIEGAATNLICTLYENKGFVINFLAFFNEVQIKLIREILKDFIFDIIEEPVEPKFPVEPF